MFTIEELKDKGMSKEELFKNTNFSFDYSLPQDWLNEFSDWCKRFKPEITYDIILGTTVWAFTPNNFYGFPYILCLETYETFICYLRNK